MKLSGNTIDSDYFDLYVPLKEKISFEEELISLSVDFYFDRNYHKQENYLRYYFKNKDFDLVNTILIKKEITAGTRQIMPRDFEESSRAIKLYFKVAVAVVLLFVTMCFLFWFLGGAL